MARQFFRGVRRYRADLPAGFELADAVFEGPDLVLQVRRQRLLYRRRIGGGGRARQHRRIIAVVLLPPDRGGDGEAPGRGKARDPHPPAARRRAAASSLR